MSLDREVAIAQESIEVITACERNGRINVRDWTPDGYPIGGHLTWDAMGQMNSAEFELLQIGVELSQIHS